MRMSRGKGTKSEGGMEARQSLPEVAAVLKDILKEYKDNSHITNKQECFRGWRETLGIAAALFLALLTFLQLREARKANNISYNTMIATTRPWVTGEFTPISLSKSDQGVNMGMEIKLNNIGHSPAQHVFVGSKLVP